MGYNYTSTLSLHHWFQFADGTALATATQEDSQVLLNVFPKWWGNLIIMLLDLKNIFGKLDHQLNVENSILQGDSLTPLIF